MANDSEDAVAFLTRQHRELEALLDALERGDGDRSENFQCLVRLSAVHETAEEIVLHPVVRSAVPDGGALADARLSEEGDAKRMLSDLERMAVDDDGFDALFHRFAQALRDHAAAEESEVFPKLKEHVEASVLEHMRAGLVTAETIAPTHPHPHGPESATGNLLVGPFVAVADRVRDAIQSVRR